MTEFTRANGTQVKCDVCTLDNALDNEYAAHLLSGKSIPINFSTYITQSQAITGDVSVNVSRAMTRLKTIFCSLDGNGPSEAGKIRHDKSFQ